MDLIQILFLISFALGVVHLTVISITLYLHRSLTHGSIVYSPFMRFLFQFWLWFACGISADGRRQWVAVHRWHHAETDKEDDPHNPKQKGPLKLFLLAFFYYRKSVNEMKWRKMPNKEETLYEHYTAGLPAYNWFDYFTDSTGPFGGIIFSLILYTILFGWFGFAIWLAQTLWMPVVAGGVINVLGHTVGHQPENTGDSSRSLAPRKKNIFSWMLVALLSFADGGEHLHNPHHNRAGSPRFGKGDGLNFDIGFMYIRLLRRFGGVSSMNAI